MFRHWWVTVTLTAFLPPSGVLDGSKPEHQFREAAYDRRPPLHHHPTPRENARISFGIGPFLFDGVLTFSYFS